MKHSFIDEYNSLQPHVAQSLNLGIGTYRVYLDSNPDGFTASAYGINRAFKVHCLVDTTFTQIEDRQTNPRFVDGYDKTGRQIQVDEFLTYSGNSTGSSLLTTKTMPANTILYGDYDHINLDSGLVIIYGI